MTDTKIAKRYVKALFAVARETDSIDTVERDTEYINKVIKTTDNVMKLFTSPVLPKKVKSSILKDLFEGKINSVTFAFLELLVKKGRETVLFDLEAEFRELLNEHRDIVDAHVTSAMPLDEDEEKSLNKKLAEITNKKINLIKEINPDIIGGLIIRIGDRLIDGSIRNDLDMMQKQLLG